MLGAGESLMSPPPDYAAVLVEINQSLNSQQNDSTLLSTESESRANNAQILAAATSSNLSANEVVQILRNSFRRAMRDNIVESSSCERLVEAVAPINHDFVIIDPEETNKRDENTY